MSSAGARLVDSADVARSEVPEVPGSTRVPTHLAGAEKSTSVHEDVDSIDTTQVSYEDLTTLHRVAGKIPWTAYTIAFVEFCERFSYYGTTVVWTNYIQQPLPPGSKTGANHGSEDYRSGAFGLGQRKAFAATTFNSFWAYFMPILGAYIADEYLGRFKTIQYAIFISITGHIILVVSALPSVIVHKDVAWGVFWLGLIVMGIGTGGFKSNISPLIAEQVPEQKMCVKTTKKGERVLLDPTATIQRLYMWFYFMINVGSLVGQISMVYAEQNVGFWLAFTLPTILFCTCPMVLFACRKNYTKAPPNKSVLGMFLKVWALAMKGRWSLNPVRTVKNMRADDFWENVKPSHFGDNKPEWMTFDDAWVDEVRRGLKACSVFLWYPIYWLTYNQMTNNLTSQAATMDTGKVPNDLIQNIDPLALVIFIPLCDQFIYPWLRRKGIKFTALKRIFWGFMTGVAGMIVAAIIQYYIYRRGPKECGEFMNDCGKTLKKLGITDVKPYAPINVWVQVPAYVLIAFSEIFASVTGLEYAFTKAPKSMRSLIMSVNLFTSAVAAALGQAFSPLADDPLLVWNYSSIAIIAFVTGILFWMAHRKLDKEEDALNMLPQGHTKESPKYSPESSHPIGSGFEDYELGHMGEEKDVVETASGGGTSGSGSSGGAGNLADFGPPDPRTAKHKKAEDISPSAFKEHKPTIKSIRRSEGAQKAEHST